MKKLFLILLTFTVLIVFATNSFAEMAGLSEEGGAAADGIAPGTIKDVKHSIKNGSEEIFITIDKYSEYRTLKLTNPDRYVIDIVNANAPGKQQVIQVNSANVKTVRYAQFAPEIARVVLDAAKTFEYRIEKKAEGLLVSIGTSANGTETSGSNGNEGSAAPRDDNASSRGGVERTSISIDKSFKINYSPKGDSDEIALNLKSYKNYNIMRLTGPDRIVVDIPNVKGPALEKKQDINSTFVKSIRYAKYGSNSTRIVLDVNSQYPFRVDEKKGQLVLNIENPKYKNVTYSNNGDRVHFDLAGVKLTEGGEILKNFYTEKFNSTGKKYTMTFPTELGDIGEGLLHINDGVLQSVEIVKNTEEKTTSIVFNAKDKFSYLVFTRNDSDDTAITILKPAAKGEKLVVIDPGHGGLDPGAKVGNLMEKNLNLDIALRLNELLKKKKIRTYMTRQGDSYLGLYERAYIANKLNASLFLSVHNNAIGDPNYGGTMTLYYPQKAGSYGFNGKTFAQTVQQKLLGSLKTTDRKIIERPNLVVLKATAMPAALAEVAFMTNKADRTNLEKAEFRQKAAQALYEAIIQSLDKVK